MRELFPAGATLPVWPVNEEGTCTCGWTQCRRPGKHADERAPATDGGPFAVITGERSGLVVIDIDRKPGAADGLAQFDELLAGVPLPPTLTVDTPSGGLHLYFKHPGFHVGNGKLASAIDVRGDEANEGGMAYVVGPGSAGYIKDEKDPSRAIPAEPYSVQPGDTVDVAPLPERLMGLLLMRGTRKKHGFAPTPVDVDTPEGARRIRMGQEACESMPASQADGEGGIRLMNVCLRLVRGLELPVEVAGALIVEHFNPRCTHADGETPYPWAEDDILHKLEDARDKSDIPCGLAPESLAKVIREHAKPAAVRGLAARTMSAAPATGRRRARPGHVYEYTIGTLATDLEAAKVSFNDLVSLFTRSDEWDGVWQFDEFAEQVLCVDPPMRLDAEHMGLTPGDLSDLRSYLEFRGILATEVEIQKAVTSASRHNRFHPVREYLAGLPAGDPAFLAGLGNQLFGDTGAHTNAFLEKFLVASVRRILSPGCQVDSILVLHGPRQGEGKTTFVAELFGEEWMRRGLSADLGNRDAAHALLGHWVIELGELASLLRTDKNAAKDFISGRDDRYRQYGNGERVRRRRQCVFVGTTNDDDFLRDATGDRRYWPVSIPGEHTIPLAWVRAHRDEVWAAAVTLAKDASYQHWFTREEELQLEDTRAPFIERDGWHEKIAEHCRGRKYVRAADAFAAIGGELKDFDRRKLLRVTDTLRRLGCRSGKFEGTKQWQVPADLAGGKPSAEEAMRRRVEEVAKKRTDAN